MGVKRRNFQEVGLIPPSLMVPSTGNYYFVDSNTGSNNNNGRSPEQPFATIDYAVGMCAASKGDVIYVMPGHAETLVGAGGITADIAGISIIGLGSGKNRPIISMGTATTVSVIVSAANVTVRNIVFLAALDNVATCFTVTGKDCTIQDCEFMDTSASLHFLSCILTGTVDNGADGLAVINCRQPGALATAGTAFISILCNCDRARIIGNYVCSAATGDVGHFMIMAAKVMIAAVITDNVLVVTGAANASVGVFMTGSSTTSTGVVARNYCNSLDSGSELFSTATITFAFFNNYYVGNTNTSGYLAPPVDVLGA